MDFHVSLAGRGDRSVRIYRQLRDAVLDGRLRAGERLPPTRELARRLAVSRNTVAVAYDRLTADGFLTGRVGAGTYVSAELPAPKPRKAPSVRGPQPTAVWRSLPPPAAEAPAPEFDFRVGIPDTALFPLDTWRRLLARELRDTAEFAHYAGPGGHPGLRAAIARHVGVSRSVRADADDVLVTQGAQQALDLLCRVLLEPGDRVAIEEPGYRMAKLLFTSHGAEVVGVPVDGEGLDVAALPPRTKLVYVTPSHQFPLGTPMSLARRTALLAWAARAGAVVVEDDYDSEFRFSDRPLEPLQSLDRDGRVAYVGSFSKTLLPMLRLGFLIAPASLRDALQHARQLSGRHGDLPAQAALAGFIDEGLFARHLRRATKVYADRHERITATLERVFAGRLRPVPSAAGLHLCALAEDETDLEPIAARAAAAGAAIQTLSDLCGGFPQQGVVLGYGSIPSASIDAGLAVLDEAWG
ncbi:GntR family transcriptional regulator fused with aminotransferase [Amycolatopsis mediterranei S699]|uniref:GntR family transcriptional regulator fused with aminotransferase n=2 Tax=Amycolatopsis mediterranei TaxID=33910 RepID=A0A0H3D4R1_AMYMU|nr:PLP-dependent aminotransferase family protein [Amycolatopsis mediterranei]ADJ45950.1 GntR family transcriptional regulator fused with aminotransferase [Amycolatopsis mediterranei U32]AEK42731.1 GntR family transcriptional regulator fused with aminotransferase [Amycolatopsis mediterranei S699]AFO77661.1 GntR family transcriptional regulator fused with aminotransferase [Amycolatopsis mediterranei S699]AGT84789.1 GntR family transcriptional regulator fused with aminotransferase [Amycolatopsis m